MIALLLGWLFATGAQWDVIQIGAWAHMWFTFAQVRPAAAALALTFTPEAMCGACRAVLHAKSEQSEHPTLAFSSFGKAPLLPALVMPFAAEFQAASEFDAPRDALVPEPQRAAPPVPPPRATA